MTQQTKDPGYYGGDETPRRSGVFTYYLGVLRRRVWVVLPFVVILGTLGAVRAFRTPQLYRTTARVLVEVYSPAVMEFQRDLRDRAGWDPDFYSTETQLLRSRAVLDVALQKSGLRDLFAPSAELDDADRPSFWDEAKRSLLAMLGAQPSPPPEPWQRLRNLVGAVHVTDTHFIDIRAVNKDPARSALLANAVAEGYQEYHRQSQVKSLNESFEMLRSERDKEEQELASAEKALQDFRETAQSVTVDMSKKDQPAIERLNRLNEQLTEIQLQRIEHNAQRGVMQDVMKGSGRVSDDSEKRLFSIPVVQTDQTLAAARKSLADVEKEMGVLSETYGADHPLLQATRSKVELLRSQFKAALGEIVQSHENRLKVLEDQERELKSEYEEQKRAAIDMAKESFAFSRLQNEVDRHRRLFDSLVERMREVDMSTGMARTNVQIVERAPVPSEPVGAGRLRTILLSIMAGLFLGGGLAFLVENLDDTVKTPEDLRERLDLPLLGFIPAIDVAESESTDASAEVPETARPKSETLASRFRDIRPTMREKLHDWLREVLPMIEAPAKPELEKFRSHRGRIVLTEPGSSVAEAYRSIRASLFYSTPANEIKLLAVTSCRPQEGKTTTSTNLAVSIAQTGKRVLLIDGDLHRPSVHRTLAIDSERGLTSVLVGECEWPDALVHVEHEGQAVDNLDILVAGPSSPNPSELLNSTRMKELLKAVRERYDWVIIDTPPVLFVSDARILSVMCDGVLVIVKAGTSTRSLLTRAREQLDMVQARIVGSILNNVKVSRMGRHYSTYYSYGYSRYSKDYKSYYYSEEGGQRRRLKTKTAATPDGAADVPTTVPSGDPGDGKDGAVRRPLTPVEQAQLHLEAGNPGRARTILEELLSVKPDETDGWEVLFGIGLQQKATDALRKNLENYTAARGPRGFIYALGSAYLAMLEQRYDEARCHFDDALTIKPSNGRALEGVLRLEVACGRPQHVEATAEKLLTLDKDNPFAFYVKGVVQLLRHDFDAAEKLIRRSLELRKTPEALNDLAWLLHKKKQFNEAEGMAREALDLGGNLHQVWDTLGTILMDMGRLDDAQKAFERAYSLASSDLGTALTLAELLVRKGDIDDALEFLQTLTQKEATLSPTERDKLEELRSLVANSRPGAGNV